MEKHWSAVCECKGERAAQALDTGSEVMAWAGSSGWNKDGGECTADTEQSENIDPGQFSTNCIQICNRRQHSYVFALWFDWMFPRCAPDRVKYYISTRFRIAAPWFSHHSGRSRTFALSQILCQMPFWMQPPHLSRSGTLTPPPTHTPLPGWVCVSSYYQTGRVKCYTKGNNNKKHYKVDYLLSDDKTSQSHRVRRGCQIIFYYLRHFICHPIV